MMLTNIPYLGNKFPGWVCPRYSHSMVAGGFEEMS